MSNDYTPRKDEAFALPPVPEPDVVDSFGRLYARHKVESYGHACAEAARAPLAEENARLLARVAELEVDLRISRDASKCLEAERDRLRADLAAKAARIEELEQYEDMVILRCGELETFDEYRAAMQRDDSDRLRADLAAKAGEVEALRGFAQKVMEAWPECGVDGFDLEDYAKEFGLIESTRVQGPCGEDCACLAACADWPTDCYHRTALLTGSGPWVNPLAAEVSALRRLLFQLYTVPGMGYTDDGELQDSTVHPSIDFLRMTPEQIQEAIRRREGKGGRLGELAAELEKLRAKIDRAEVSYGNMLRADDKRPDGTTEYTRGWGDCLRAIAARKGEGVAGA